MRYVLAGAIRALVLGVTMGSGVAIACNNGDVQGVEEAEVLALYERFQSCRGLDATEAVSCVADTTAEDSSPQLNEKIAKWLLDLDILGAPEDCPYEIVRLFPPASENRYVAIRCVSYAAFGTNDRALFYFEKNAGELKIAGIQKVKL